MNPVIQLHSKPRAGYTLIELLVVMAIIAMIAGLILPVTRSLKKRQMLTVAQAEMNQIQTGIETYKSKLGFYPPDNPQNPAMSPLYFELVGTTVDQNNNYKTLDGSGQVQYADLTNYFNVSGLANSGTSVRGTDDKPGPQTFLMDLKPNQVAQFIYSGTTPWNALLVCSRNLPPGTLPGGVFPAIPTTSTFVTQPPVLNPWRYVSTQPTNNIGRFDLWVDLVIGNNVYRVCNWRTGPQLIQ